MPDPSPDDADWPDWHVELRNRTEGGELIWHYCSWEGLKGIIQKEYIRASNALFLSDSRELIESQKIIHRMLDDTKNTALLKRIDEFAQPPEGTIPHSAYVVSFSQAFDSLGQWRGYAAPGPSFSIAFRRADLQAIVGTHGFYLHSCAYTTKEREQAIEEVREQFKNSGYASGSSYMAWEWDQTVAAQRLAARIKNIAFKDEAEVRLIGGNPRHADSQHLETEFFQRGSLIVPCLKLPLRVPEIPPAAPLPIDLILVGPTPHPELTWTAVKQLLSPLTKGMIGPPQEIEVRRSIIPYRNW